VSGITIMLVEDEPNIAEVVSLYLHRAGYQVQVIDNGKSALEKLKLHLPDLVILDLMLPEVNGIEITKWIRDKSNVPIIMLTSRRSEMDRIGGLEMGADDYIVKPFSPQELVSRVRAVLRRTISATEPIPDPPLDYGNLRIDSSTRMVYLNRQEINLTAKEFDLLLLLARHPRQVFSRDQLLEQVWGHSEYIDPGTVTVHIRRLREKIENDPSIPIHIITVWGIGYKFIP
jgi:DNA-binding response OmpR family regulator